MPYVRFSIQVDTDESEPSRVVRKIHGVVFDSAEESEYEVKLGEVDAFLLLTGLAAEKGESIFDAMDCISDATTECYGAVFDPNSDGWNSAVLDLYTGGPMNSDLLFIDRISLDEKYRGRGIGAQVVRETIDTSDFTVVSWFGNRSRCNIQVGPSSSDCRAGEIGLRGTKSGRIRSGG